MKTKFKATAFITLVCTMLLIALGGYVHNTQSSLACPDWPLCYGQFFPNMEGGILIEHSHRLLASFVGLLTILLMWFGRRIPAVKMGSIILFFVVCFQGLLGGITVIYRLPTIVSTTHLGTSLVFLGLLFWLYHRVSFKAENKVTDPILKHYSLLALSLLFLQILLGAFMRHAGVGAACGLGPEAALMCFDTQTLQTTLWPTLSGAQLHMVHRIFSIIVSAVIFFSSWKAAKALPKFHSWLPSLLIIAQVILGVMTVYSKLGVNLTTLHLVFAALTLILQWGQYLDLRYSELGTTQKLSPSLLSDFIGLTKPRLSALVILTSAIGLTLAPGSINFFTGLLALILISVVVGAACALNCFMEIEIDKKMERTKDRGLPSGRLLPLPVLSLSLITLSFSLYGLYHWINPMTAYLGAISAVLYLLAYTPLKKFSGFSVIVGAIPGALPPVMGWTSVTGELGPMVYYLFGILFLWQVPHFLSIALFYEKDYKSADIKTWAQVLSPVNIKLLIFLLTIVVFFISLGPYLQRELSRAYAYAAIFLGISFIGYSVRGFFAPEGPASRAWAKNYFRASIIYLPLLLGFMIFLR